MASSVFIWPGLFTNSGSAIVFPSNFPIDVQRTALGTTSTDGVIVENTTAATAGATVQISPRIKLLGAAWNSSGSASETDYFVIENLPATVAGTTTATLKFGVSIAGGAVTYPLTISSLGTVTTGGQLTTGGNLTLNTNLLTFGTPGARQNNVAANQFNWTNLAQNAGVGFDFGTDALLKVRTIAQTGYATVDALGYKVSGVAGLTASGVFSTFTIVGGLITAAS